MHGAGAVTPMGDREQRSETIPPGPTRADDGPPRQRRRPGLRRCAHRPFSQVTGERMAHNRIRRAAGRGPVTLRNDAGSRACRARSASGASPRVGARTCLASRGASPFAVRQPRPPPHREEAGAQRRGREGPRRRGPELRLRRRRRPVREGRRPPRGPLRQGARLSARPRLLGGRPARRPRAAEAGRRRPDRCAARRARPTSSARTPASPAPGGSTSRASTTPSSWRRSGATTCGSRASSSSRCTASTTCPRSSRSSAPPRDGASACWSTTW